MDGYSVGSLAELISGEKTENKRKVIIREYKFPAKRPLLSAEESVGIDVTKKKGINQLAHKNHNRDSEVASSGHSDKVKKTKKQKHVVHAVKTDNTENARDTDIYNDGHQLKLPNHIQNAERRIKLKNKTINKNMDTERNNRTVFVGNVPIKAKKETLKKLFMKCGIVEAVRLRCAPVADPRIPKKVAIIKQEFHPDRTSIHSYVRFATREEAEKALSLNGKLFKGNHLRVTLCDEEKKRDEQKAIFVGNISFGAEEEELWKIFGSVGTISSVRLIRDAKTGMGKGFGYVNFENSDSVELALQMEAPVLRKKELRISRYITNAPKKLKKKKTTNSEKGQNNNSKFNDEKNKRPLITIKNKIFQGSKFADKKKHKNKVSKAMKRKKMLIKQFAAPSGATG